MLMTRFVYIVLFLVNLAINGLALLHITGVYATDDQIVPAALLFNLLFWPIATFAAYRSGGMTEEIYRRKELAVRNAASTRMPGATKAARTPSGSEQPTAAAEGAKADEPARASGRASASKTAGPSQANTGANTQANTGAKTKTS